MAETTKSKQRGPGRPFQPGVSGNPSGRPVGSKNKTTIAALALLDGEAEKLSRKAIELALLGDVGALRLCIDKVVPARKDRPVEIELKRIESPSDACEVISDLIEAVGKGELSPSEADVIAGLVERRAKLSELHELEARLKRLEEAAG